MYFLMDFFFPPEFLQGYLVNWDVQRQVWDYLFGKEMYQVRPSFVCLLNYQFL